MQKSGEKLCLQWNDFRDNISSAFGDLRDDEEFTDVTLACEDGQQVKVHKVVLIASSPFFLNLLKKNKHPHPLVFMRGVKFEDLVSMVDFLYNGIAYVDKAPRFSIRRVIWILLSDTETSAATPPGVMQKK